MFSVLFHGFNSRGGVHNDLGGCFAVRLSGLALLHLTSKQGFLGSALEPARVAINDQCHL